MEPKQIIAKIDNHIFQISEIEYNTAFDSLTAELKARDIHFDNSPFGAILNLCDVNDLSVVLYGDNDHHYWTKRILEGKKINLKFDLKNYIKRQFNKELSLPATRTSTSKERLAEKRAWDRFWNYQ